VFGLLVAVGGEQRHAEHHVGFVEHGRRLEVVAVEPDRLMHVARREVRGEGIGQTLGGGQLSAEQARTEQPDRHVAVHPGHGDHALIGLPRAEQQLQFLDVLRKVVGTAHTVAAQGVGGELVGARCTAKAQVDAAGIQRLQRAELFGDHQRRMVGQHHPAGTEADARGVGRQITDQHGGGGAGDAVHVVVFGDPETLEAEPFHVPRQRQGVVQRLGRRAVVTDRCQVEGGKAGLGNAGHR